MNFDIEQFLAEQGIEYKRGPAKNVKSGWLGIDCVFCGDDQGKHLGINLANGHYSCWRNTGHKGGLAYLVAALMRCPLAHAKQIIGEKTGPTPGGQSWAELSAAFTAAPPATPASPKIEFYPEMQTLRESRGAKRFTRYLTGRGFSKSDLAGLCRRYGLRYALTGAFAYRLIIPLYNARNALLGWQGRAIGPAENRYMSYPSGPDIKQQLLFSGYGGGENLFVVEGPLDYLKGDFYGGKENRLAALLGIDYTPAQIGALYRVAPLYQRRFVLFDAGAFPQALRLCRELAKFGFRAVEVPGQVAEDMGAVKPQSVRPLLAALAAGKSYCN